MATGNLEFHALSTQPLLPLRSGQEPITRTASTAAVEGMHKADAAAAVAAGILLETALAEEAEASAALMGATTLLPTSANPSQVWHGSHKHALDPYKTAILPRAAMEELDRIAAEMEANAAEQACWAKQVDRAAKAAMNEAEALYQGRSGKFDLKAVETALKPSHCMGGSSAVVESVAAGAAASSIDPAIPLQMDSFEVALPNAKRGSGDGDITLPSTPPPPPRRPIRTSVEDRNRDGEPSAVEISAIYRDESSDTAKKSETVEAAADEQFLKDIGVLLRGLSELERRASSVPPNLQLFLIFGSSASKVNGCGSQKLDLPKSCCTADSCREWASTSQAHLSTLQNLLLCSSSRSKPLSAHAFNKAKSTVASVAFRLRAALVALPAPPAAKISEATSPPASEKLVRVSMQPEAALPSGSVEQSGAVSPQGIVQAAEAVPTASILPLEPVPLGDDVVNLAASILQLEAPHPD
eukprot:TRINITY_DN31392_c0_g1_i1.p1 TRINITY_DN31392_c0_g1~~TRINITY_DN31392_c0_g1_i1.p1  ORF type:complete len:470 (-),score=144.88 TRINITY_DN31392_c0_g1_i1:130-1539(-)